MASATAATYGAIKILDIKPGDDVLIYGGGPVGLSFVKLGRLFGLGWIGLVDRHKEKRELAKQFGASETFDRNDESVNEIASRETLKKLVEPKQQQRLNIRPNILY